MKFENYKKYLFEKWTEENNCWRFVRKIYWQELGIELPKIPYSGDLEKIIGAQKESGDWIEVKESKPYDVILIKTGHVAIVVDPVYAIHCPRNSNSCAVKILSLQGEIYRHKIINQNYYVS